MKTSVEIHEPVPTAQSADAFRGYEEALKTAKAQHEQDLRTETSENRQKRVTALIDEKITDAAWEEVVDKARKAAANGERQYLLLRFPSELCSDDARAINNPPDPTWPQTLRGEAAEVYERWHTTLRQHGFNLSAQVLDFPDGKPGDVGLFLRWGE